MVRKFVKEPGHADSYIGLKVNYIPGHPPELVCFEGEKEIERINLEDKSLAKLHVMMEDRNLKRKDVEVKDEL